jgi:hypothetical protein
VDATTKRYREATLDGADGVVLVKERFWTNTAPKL